MSDPRLRSRAHTALRSLVSLGFLVASLRVVVLAAPNPVRPYKLPPNLLEYFKSRYDLPDDMIVSTLRETPDGPLGHINVHGKLTIASPMGATREERARSATRAFLQHEAAFLDIADFSEIRELSIKFNDSERYEWLRGECDVQYERALGGIALYGTLYRFHVDPKGFITTFQATLVPVSSDLYAAVMRDKIARDEAGAIVEHDLESLDLRKTAVAVGEPTLAAYWRAPHVLWEVRGTYKPEFDKVLWYYGIDAFSGQIVRRDCSTGLVYVRAPDGHMPSPCDAIPAIPKEGSPLPYPF